MQHRHRCRVFQIVFKGGIRHHHIVVSQVIVQQPAHPFGAKQRRVALDEGVQSLFLHQVGANALDLIGRAAMHGGQGYVIGNAVGDFQLPDRGVKARHLVNQGLFISRTVPHLLQEPLYIWLLDYREVVTHTEIEHDAG